MKQAEHTGRKRRYPIQRSRRIMPEAAMIEEALRLLMSIIVGDQ